MHVYIAKAPFRLGSLRSCQASIREYVFYSEEEFKQFIKHMCDEYSGKGYSISYKEEDFEVGYGDVVVYVHDRGLGEYAVTLIFIGKTL